MNDDMMLEYLLQAGAMRPEEEQLMRKQAMVDALRQNAAQPLQNTQAGRVTIAPSWTQGLAQLANAYGARRGQQQVDAGLAKFNTQQRDALMAMRDRMRPPAQVPPQAPRAVKGSFGPGWGYNPEEDY